MPIVFTVEFQNFGFAAKVEALGHGSLDGGSIALCNLGINTPHHHYLKGKMEYCI